MFVTIYIYFIINDNLPHFEKYINNYTDKPIERIKLIYIITCLKITIDRFDHLHFNE